jgi:hypothetical protein
LSSGRSRAVGALGLYALLACGVLARGVAGAPTSNAVGDSGPDKTIFMWAFEWWPHALGKGKDPFVSHAVWAPHGVDLSWATAVPALSLLVAPLTWAAGPVATYNVLAVLAPALAAWSAFLLAEWLTGGFWPALIAGYLFGFSAYELAESQGHLHLTLIFVVPLCGLLLARRLSGELSRARFVAFLSVALAFQLLTSSEVLSTTLLVGLVLGLLALWRFPEERSRLLATARETGLSIVACGVLALPFLIHAFVLSGPSHAPVRSPFSQAADLLNFVVPTHVTWLRPPGSGLIASDFTANPVEAGAYLGLPLLAILVLAGLGRPRDRTTRFLLLALATIAVCSLGSRVRIDGHALLPGPWELPAKLPVTKAILPVRLSLFVVLLAALVCALWLAGSSRHAGLRWALALLAAIAVFPTPSRGFWTTTVPNPAFFRAGGPGLEASDTVLILPLGKAGWSMLWQAEDGMRYRMAGGHLGSRPPEEDRWHDFLRAIISGRRIPPGAGRMLRQYIRAHGVTVVVVAPGTKPSLRRLARTLPVRPQHRADALLYRLSA